MRRAVSCSRCPMKWSSCLKKIDDRIVIEKAKGLLMARDHLSEPEAFKRIRTISMQKRVPMIEIAKLLVLQDDV